MKQGVIDIGSNSIRLSVYEINKTNFRILFREKIMAGLASYVDNGALNCEGIEQACAGLQEFRQTLDTLGIQDACVFATASLRNIANTKEACEAIYRATGFVVDVVSGHDEAMLGYLGVMQDLQLSSGTFFDVGGASTEVVSFHQRVVEQYASFPVGSLSLYKHCVKGIVPGEGSLARLQQTIESTFATWSATATKTATQADTNTDTQTATKTNTNTRAYEAFTPARKTAVFASESAKPLHTQATHSAIAIGVGGTARACLKLARRYFQLPKNAVNITANQLEQLVGFLTSGSKEATRLILRHEADRIHTLIPGVLILHHVFCMSHSQELVVSKYGVREGYLCCKVLKKTTTSTPKIVN